MERGRWKGLEWPVLIYDDFSNKKMESTKTNAKYISIKLLTPYLDAAIVLASNVLLWKWSFPVE